MPISNTIAAILTTLSMETSIPINQELISSTYCNSPIPQSCYVSHNSQLKIWSIQRYVETITDQPVDIVYSETMPQSRQTRIFYIKKREYEEYVRDYKLSNLLSN